MLAQTYRNMFRNDDAIDAMLRSPKFIHTAWVDGALLAKFDGMVKVFEPNSTDYHQKELAEEYAQKWISARWKMSYMDEGVFKITFDDDHIYEGDDGYKEWSCHAGMDFVVPPTGHVYVRMTDEEIAKHEMDYMAQIVHDFDMCGDSRVSRKMSKHRAKELADMYGYQDPPTRIHKFSSEYITVNINGRIMRYTFGWDDAGTVGYARMSGGQAIGATMTNLDIRWGLGEAEDKKNVPFLYCCGHVQHPGHSTNTRDGRKSLKTEMGLCFFAPANSVKKRA